MYKCSKCGKKITEFDVNFSKNLFGKFDSENKCECAQCVANVNALQKPKKRKPKTIFYLLPYIIIACVAFVVVLFIKNPSLIDKVMPYVWIVKLFGENWFSMILSLLFGFVILFLLFLIPSGYVLSIMKVMEDLGVEDDSYEVDVYRTTYDSSSDSFTTTKGKDYAGGSSWPLFAGILYPVWGIFALIIKTIRCNAPDRNSRKYIKNNFSKKVIRAYEKAKIETESIVISKKQCNLKQKQEYKYNERCNQIKNKYGYLNDKDIISKKIEKLPEPYVRLKSNKGTCYKWVDGDADNYVLLDKRNNERIYNGIFFYYTDDKDDAKNKTDNQKIADFINLSFDCGLSPLSFFNGRFLSVAEDFSPHSAYCLHYKSRLCLPFSQT